MCTLQDLICALGIFISTKCMLCCVTTQCCWFVYLNVGICLIPSTKKYCLSTLFLYLAYCTLPPHIYIQLFTHLSWIVMSPLLHVFFRLRKQRNFRCAAMSWSFDNAIRTHIMCVWYHRTTECHMFFFNGGVFYLWD